MAKRGGIKVSDKKGGYERPGEWCRRGGGPFFALKIKNSTRRVIFNNQYFTGGFYISFIIIFQYHFNVKTCFHLIIKTISDKFMVLLLDFKEISIFFLF